MGAASEYIPHLIVFSIVSIPVTYIVIRYIVGVYNNLNFDTFHRTEGLYNEINFSKYMKNDISSISGLIDGVNVDVEIIVYRRKIYLNARVVHSLDLSQNIKITMETTGSRMKKNLGIEDYITGDSNFDEKMLLLGNNELELRSLLSHNNRKNIYFLAMDSHDLALTQHYVIVSKYFKKRDFTDSANQFIKSIIVFTGKLIYDKDFKKQLIENIKTEKNSQVQKRNIEILVAHYEKDKEIIDVLKGSLRDSSISVQIAAAKNSLDVGMAHLVNILENKEYIDNEDLIEIIHALNFYRYFQSAGAMEKVYKKTKSIDAKREILLALKNFKVKTVSGFLQEELFRADPDLVVPIIDALGVCGTIEAVEALHKFSRIKFGATILNAVNKAIARIQANLGDVDKGWLSVEPLSEKDGALSISDESKEGALSIDGDE